MFAPRASLTLLACSFWLLALLAAPGDAFAADGAVQATARESEYEARHVLALKAITIIEVTPEATETVAGPGMLYEFAILPRMLNFEAAAAVVFSSEHTSLPVDVLLKLPIKVNRVVDLYLGVGPAAKILVHPEADVHFGVLASFGSYFWLDTHWGLLAEIDYGYIAEGDGLHEAEAGAGVAFRL